MTKGLSVLPWFFIALALGLVAARVYTRYRNPTYNVAAWLLIRDARISNDASNNILKDLGVNNSDNSLENEMDILRSFSMTTKVVERTGVYIDVFEKGRVKTTRLYGTLSPLRVTYHKQISNPGFAKQVGITVKSDSFYLKSTDTKGYRYGDTVLLNDTKFVFERNEKVKLVAESEYFIRVLPINSAVNSLMGKFTTKPTQQASGVLMITYTDESAERGVDLLKALTEEYVNAGLDERNLAAKKSLDFINTKLQTLDTSLKSAQSRVIQFKIANKYFDASAESIGLLTSTKELDKTIAEQETQLEILKELERYINSSNEYETVPSTYGFTEPTIGALISQHNNYILQRKQALQQGLANDPAVVRYNDLIKNSRRAIIENISTIRGSVDIRTRDSKAKLSGFDSRLSQLPAQEKELIDLEREARVIDQIYTMLLEKREEAELTLASSRSNARILDPARMTGMVGASTFPVYIMAIVLALIIPILILVLTEVLNQKISEKKEIESRTSVPIIGEVGYVDNLEESIVITPKSRSSISEQFRLIRTNLQYYQVEDGVKTILVTSHIAGEGKSFITLNMAASIALTNKKVVVLEFDLRKPKISKYIHMTKGVQGISNLVVDSKLKPADIIYEVENKQNLYVVPCGPIPPNPAELILSNRISELFEYLKANFDMVIIDSPP
ncbi:MAG: hypothetical protein EAY75_05595, partial [Bacteroidetes bacterium]